MTHNKNIKIKKHADPRKPHWAIAVKKNPMKTSFQCLYKTFIWNRHKNSFDVFAPFISEIHDEQTITKETWLNGNHEQKGFFIQGKGSYVNSLGIAMKYLKPQKYYKNMICLSKQNMHWSLFTAIQHQERLRGIKKRTKMVSGEKTGSKWSMKRAYRVPRNWCRLYFHCLSVDGSASTVASFFSNNI